MATDAVDGGGEDVRGEDGAEAAGPAPLESPPGESETGRDGRGPRGVDPEAGVETRDELLKLRRLWFGAKEQRRRGVALAAERMPASDDAGALRAFDRLALPATSLLIAIEDRAARLALLSASVILPGEPTPLDGFTPVSVDLGGGLRCTVAPAVPFADDPKGCGRRRVSFT